MDLWASSIFFKTVKLIEGEIMFHLLLYCSALIFKNGK